MSRVLFDVQIFGGYVNLNWLDGEDRVGPGRGKVLELLLITRHAGKTSRNWPDSAKDGHLKVHA